MKKSVALGIMMALAVSAVASAAPMTSWEKGEGQVDLGAWWPKSKVSAYHASPTSKRGHNHVGKSKANFYGGMFYGFTDKLGLEYSFHGLNTKELNKGNEHEINLVYSLAKNLAVYGGYNRIKYEYRNVDVNETNNVAQLGLIAKAPLGNVADIYARGALGTKDTALWEAGMAFKLGKDFDLNAGYRYISTERDDHRNIKFRGILAGLSYRFGGHKKAEPVYVPEPVAEPVAVAEPVPEHVWNDYYLDSIHFGFDEDQPLASEQAKIDNFLQVAKDYPDTSFKLIGNTDSYGTNEYNDDLSKRRVDNIAAIATNNGVAADRLNLDYKGKTNPVDTNETDAGRANNRRVDIYHHK